MKTASRITCFDRHLQYDFVPSGLQFHIMQSRPRLVARWVVASDGKLVRQWQRKHVTFPDEEV